MGFIYRNSILPQDYQKKISFKGGFYYNNEIYFSIAYQKLTPSSKNLLHCFIFERRWEKKTKEITNNGSISFTQVQFKEIFGYSKETYLKARNQLIECGFIKQTERGGMCRGDMAKYKILCLDDVLYHKQRWRDYPDKNWINDIPKPKKQLVGVNTQWKKGQSGRKKNTTLPKYTLNEPNDPIKVDTKQ